MDKKEEQKIMRKGFLGYEYFLARKFLKSRLPACEPPKKPLRIIFCSGGVVERGYKIHTLRLVCVGVGARRVDFFANMAYAVPYVVYI